MKAPRIAILIALVLLSVATRPLQAKDSPKAILDRLPNKIASFTHGELSDYDDPRLGASIPFNFKGLAITLYVYDLGHNTIADGIKDPKVIQAIEMAKNEIQMAQERGSYLDVRLLSEGKGNFDGRDATLQAKYQLVMTQGGAEMPVFTEIHVFGAWNQIFKLRITMDRDAHDELAPKVNQFIAALLQAVEFLPPVRP